MTLSRRRLRAAVTAALAVALPIALAGCAAGGQTDGPATINTATPSGGPPVVAVPSRGTASGGEIALTAASYVRLAGTALQINMRIANSGSTPDELIGATSNIGKSIVLTPATIPVPAGGSVTLTAQPPKMIVTPYEKLVTRETIELTLDFRRAGTIQVYLGEQTTATS